MGNMNEQIHTIHFFLGTLFSDKPRLSLFPSRKFDWSWNMAKSGNVFIYDGIFPFLQFLRIFRSPFSQREWTRPSSGLLLRRDRLKFWLRPQSLAAGDRRAVKRSGIAKPSLRGVADRSPDGFWFRQVTRLLIWNFWINHDKSRESMGISNFNNGTT